MNYQTFSNLQFRPFLKTLFHSFNIDLRETRGEKKASDPTVSFVLFSSSEKPPKSICDLKDVTSWLLQDE